jgi:ABC-2 type transport system permease protein
MKDLLKLNFLLFRNSLRRLSLFDDVKIAVFAFIGMIFLSALYVASWRFMSYLNGVAIIGPLLVNKLMGMIYLTGFSMVIFSGIITSFTTLFSSSDLRWLMATPVNTTTVFVVKAIETAFYSSWMVVLALVPFLIAFAQVKSAPWWFIMFACAVTVIFLSGASFIGTVLATLITRLFPARPARDFVMVCGIIFAMGGLVLLRLLEPEKLVRPDSLATIQQYLEYLNAPVARSLPSWWVVRTLFAGVAGAYRSMFMYCGLVLLFTGTVFSIAVIMAYRWFVLGWTENNTTGMRKKALQSLTPSWRSRESLVFLTKDFTIFFRDPNQWSQILILAALALVYLFSLHKLPLDTWYLQNLIAFLNLGLIGFIMAAVSLRFVFPLISIEHDTLWLYRSAPVSMGKFLISKLVFGSSAVLVMGGILIIVSNYIMKSSGQVILMTVVAGLMMGIALPCMALGFGALFPVFNSTNIAQIESSAGGVFFIICALFYLVIHGELWAIPVRNFYFHKIGITSMSAGHLRLVGVILLVVNLAVSIIPLYAGYRKLQSIEI